MALATFSIRMDKELKSQFDILCEEFGMNASTAFNVFARAVVRNKKIPFEISSTTEAQTASLEKGKAAFYKLREVAAQNKLYQMSNDEINQEIADTRAEYGK